MIIMMVQLVTVQVRSGPNHYSAGQVRLGQPAAGTVKVPGFEASGSSLKLEGTVTGTETESSGVRWTRSLTVTVTVTDTETAKVRVRRVQCIWKPDPCDDFCRFEVWDKSCRNCYPGISHRYL